MKRQAHVWVLILALFLSRSGCNCESGPLGALFPKIEVSPAALDLGEVPQGVRAHGAITLKSIGDTSLQNRGISIVGQTGFLVLSEHASMLPPGAAEAILVEAQGIAIGDMAATLRVASNDPDRSMIEIPIVLHVIPAPPCDDGNTCTDDGFDPESVGCVHSFANGTPCFPADRCIVNAVCDQGVCLGQAKPCADSNACTRDLCRQTDGECTFIRDESACDDVNPCTIDTCGPTGCLHETLPSGSPCDDGDLCTTQDSCFAGSCRGMGVPDGSRCDDADSCTVSDTCFDGVCTGQSVIARASEGDVVFDYPLTPWPGGFVHRREVSLSDDGVFFGLDHLPIQNPPGLTHVVSAMHQCGTSLYEFSYRPPDSHVLVRFVRREMQLQPDNTLRIVVGIRQLPENGYRPETTMYELDRNGSVKRSQIQVLGGETGRSLLPDGSHIFGVIWPLSEGAPTPDNPARQNLVMAREDRSGNVLWTHERSSWDWAEFLGVAGPRVLFWSDGRFGALDFNTGSTVWTSPTQQITKEMALSTSLNLGVARASTQLIGVEILQGRTVFMFPETEDLTYVPRTDPVISSDGRVLVLMQRNTADLSAALSLEWVELDEAGSVLSATTLPYSFPADFASTRHEDDPYPTVADDGVSYVGYGDRFFALDPGGGIRFSLTSTIPNAYTGTVPLLRDDGILLINEDHRRIKGIRSNGGKMSSSGWASFRHDGRRTNYTP